MPKNKPMEAMPYEPEGNMEVGEKECKNMMDHTVGDEVEFMGRGMVKRMSSENGMRMGMKVTSVKLMDAKKEKKEKKEEKKAGFPIAAFRKGKK